MLIRISLIIAILAGATAAALDFTVLKTKITQALDERDLQHKNFMDETTKYNTTKKDLDTTKATLQRTQNDLTSTRNQLSQANNHVTELEKTRDDLTTRLTKSNQDRDSAQNDLAAWKLLGIPVEKVRQSLADLAADEARIQIEVSEKKVLMSEYNTISNKLARLLDQNYVVVEPEGLRGKVLVADPKYEFVVLNIGKNQGVLVDGDLLVERDGKLVGKVRVQSVEADRCIANVLPRWKQADVMEGDIVLD